MECLQTLEQLEKRIDRLNELETMQEDGTFDVLPKKEVIILKKKWKNYKKSWWN